MVVAVHMKKYVLDELEPDEYKKLKDHLDTHLISSGVEGVYWMILDDEMLNPVQKEHTACYPFYLAVELTKSSLNCELLVRATQRLRCDCIAYTNERQRAWAIHRIERMAAILSI